MDSDRLIGDEKVWAIKVEKQTVLVKDFYWTEIDEISRETDYLPSFILGFPTQNLRVAAALVKKAYERCGKKIDLEKATTEELVDYFDRVEPDLPDEYQGKES